MELIRVFLEFFVGFCGIGFIGICLVVVECFEVVNL